MELNLKQIELYYSQIDDYKLEQIAKFKEFRLYHKTNAYAEESLSVKTKKYSDCIENKIYKCDVLENPLRYKISEKYIVRESYYFGYKVLSTLTKVFTHLYFFNLLVYNQIIVSLNH